jgi:RNA polymerase sigma-54 factor
VELNPEATPRLRVNADYAALIRRADNSLDNQFLKNHLQEARWFIKSLKSRNETLLRVATKIVEFQRGFLEHGDVAMRPLVLRDIAEALGMHESTISRVTSQKYMHTPRGTLECKYFFSSHVSTSSGGEASATAIRALIKQLVAAERPDKPLSDSKIAEILGEQGIEVARRTVAKYREAMAIPPSNERKRLV